MENGIENIQVDNSEHDIASTSVQEGQNGCYCGRTLGSSLLKCSICERKFHTTCLKSGRQSSLKGDVFFDFTCVQCSESGVEKCVRRQLNWLQVVYLALYNLICNGSGRKGYFRWKDHLCHFIESNWSTFHGDRKKTSSWRSTVAGILSNNCPKYFKNGQKEFREGGWWTLTEVLPPCEKLEASASAMTARRRKASSQVAEVVVKKTRTSERKKKMEEQMDDTKVENVKEEVEEPAGTDEVCVENDGGDVLEGFLEHHSDLLELDIGDVDPTDSIFDDFDEVSNASLTSSFPEMNISEKNEVKSDEKMDSKSDNMASVNENEGVIVLDPEEMITTQCLGKPVELSKRGRQATEQAGQPSQELRLMQPHEEQVFFETLNSLNSRNVVARRLRQKLQLRQRKRQHGLPVFDLDDFVKRTISEVTHYVVSGNEVVPVMADISKNNPSPPRGFKTHKRVRSASDRILDRFMTVPHPVNYKPEAPVTFLTRLVGSDYHVTTRPITSPYTSRVLKPYIRQDFETRPLKLKLLEELCLRYQSRGADAYWSPPTFGPIDYCYVQPYHIPSVNALCREFFWPGIDLSECLQYPDFSCVALYKRLVIGCSFMVPDVKCNEAYISFIVVHPDWRRSGIGSFMMYHLIQTCLGKDVTLHVAANNPSMLMYQKFGFKPERFVVNFYDRYLNAERYEHKHAFFLRLRR